MLISVVTVLRIACLAVPILPIAVITIRLLALTVLSRHLLRRGYVGDRGGQPGIAERVRGGELERQDGMTGDEAILVGRSGPRAGGGIDHAELSGRSRRETVIARIGLFADHEGCFPDDHG